MIFAHTAQQASDALSGIFSPNKRALRQAARVMIACGMTYALIHVLALEQGFWAIVTVLIVMQGVSVGATIGAATDRLIATIAGAVLGGAALLVTPQGMVATGISLVVVTGLCAFAAMRTSRLRVAGITAAIVMLTRTPEIPVTVFVVDRILEIGLGGVIGVICSRLILPTRSRKELITRLKSVIEATRDMLETHAKALESGQAGSAVEAGIALRKSLTAAEGLQADVRRERSAFMAKHGVSDAIPRTLWRIRNDIMHINRLDETPFRPFVAEKVGKPAAGVLRAEAEFIRRCGQALEEDHAVDRSEDDIAMKQFEQAFADFSQSEDVREIPFEQVGRLFGLAFALRKMRQDFHDLADRIDESYRV
ncbi:FUSC family protein [Altericroceibacterium endophyticum]|uniref:FUSC family protein n=1 Tax=Altericroceibacterium endophyticum TaxID=1808508 RepID=A0A6I4TA79_9SPHN|nr:FUSC family protein [Altericroceibacterium endophyticum]MXO66780.1 FUSC family protein [Altericroceibacterium endophyticum]